MTFLTILLATSGHAWETVGSRWAPESIPVPYWIDANLDVDLDDDATVQAIEAGMAVWNTLGCDVSFEYQGRHDGAPFGSEPDGRNVVYLVGDDWPLDATEAAFATMWTHGNDLFEVDYGMNGHHFQWSVSDLSDGSDLDVIGGAVEGGGHMLGLWHTDVEDASLHPAMVGQIEARTLEDDDIAGACALYSDQRPTGLGAACSEPDDCASEICLADGATSYCSRTCKNDDDCSINYVCEGAGGEQVCARSKPGECGCSVGAWSMAPWPVVMMGVVARRRRPRSERSAGQ